MLSLFTVCPFAKGATIATIDAEYISYICLGDKPTPTPNPPPICFLHSFSACKGALV